jgi:hypothetical protein
MDRYGLQAFDNSAYYADIANVYTANWNDNALIISAVYVNSSGREDLFFGCRIDVWSQSIINEKGEES